MKVRNSLAAIFALVDHEAVSIPQSELLGDDLGRVENPEVVTRFRKGREALDFGSRDDQDVDRGDGLDVPKGDDVFILIDDFSRDFSLDDSGE